MEMSDRPPGIRVTSKSVTTPFPEGREEPEKDFFKGSHKGLIGSVVWGLGFRVQGRNEPRTGSRFIYHVRIS